MTGSFGIFKKSDAKQPGGSLDEMMAIGSKACEFARQQIQICYTSPIFRSQVKDLDDAKKMSDEFVRNRHDYINDARNQSTNLYAALIDQVKTIQSQPTGQRVGQCLEYATLCFHHIVEKLKDDKENNFVAYLVTIDEGDHEIVILDQKLPDSDSFSSNAIIIDAWSEKKENQVYKYSEREHRLLALHYEDHQRQIKYVPFKEAEYPLSRVINSDDVIYDYKELKEAGLKSRL